MNELVGDTAKQGSSAFIRLARMPALAARLISGRIPEVSLVALGLLLRLSMITRFDVKLGYDARYHWRYIDWFRYQWALPPLKFTRETYHPPLYYLIAGALNRWVRDQALMGIPSVVFGSLTVLLVWWGLERHLENQRLARCTALALLAVLPASVHLSGMMSGEGLNGLLSVAALLIAAERLRNPTSHPIATAIGLGVVLGLGMLTKISALVIIGSIFTAAGLQWVWSNASVTQRLKRAAPWVLSLAVLLATSGWYFARNQRLYGKPILSGFDGVDGPPPARIENLPYLDKRPLAFFIGWTNDVFRSPYYPSGIQPRSRFWPVLVTSTFVDYYNYAFIRPDPQSPLKANGRPIRVRSLGYARASAMGGALIALTTVVAWVIGAARVIRARDAARLLLCIAPGFALLGQLHFAVRYPVDTQGPTKGLYMQFASAPLLAIFGLAVAWLAGKRWTRPLLVLEALAVAAVAAYTIYARLTW